MMRSIRTRMMLLFCAVVGLLLAASYLGYYGLLQNEVRGQLDGELRGAAGPVLRDLISEPNSQDINELNLPGEYFELLDSSGKVLQHSQNLRSALARFSLPRGSTEVSFTTVTDSAAPQLRVCIIPFERGSQRFFFVLAVPTAQADHTLATFRRVTLVLLPFSLLLTAAVSAWYVGRVLKPIAVVTDHAAQMTKRVSDPQRRLEWLPLSVTNPRDELGRLASTFNKLLNHVDSALSQLRQFVTDASHELRTPLSVLQVETELLLSERNLSEHYKKPLTVIHDELKKLSRIVEGLFTLAMADAGQLKLSADPVYLDEVLEEACSIADQIAKPKHITIERHFRNEVPYSGDEAFLRDLFLIFLENAIKYSPSNTRVQVAIEQNDTDIRVRFVDEGIGIEREHLPFIFDRFYRVVQSNAGEARSGGLGLAIAKVIVASQHGSISCESTPGKGSTFVIALPLLSSAATAMTAEINKT